MKYALLGLILATGLCAKATFDLREGSPAAAVLANREGVEQLKKSNPAAAQNRFIEALSKAPYDARIHLNLGLSFEMLGQPDKAEASYRAAQSLAKDGEALFSAHFNIGQLQQKAKKVDEALVSYQEALKIDPNSKETKTNIELMTQSQQGGGKGDSKDQDKDKNDKDKNKDKNDQNKDNKDDKKDDKDDKGQDKDKKPDDKKEYKKNKPQPQKFKSEELNQGDVNKILGEIKQQEQKIRAEFNKKDVKETAKDKDW